MFETFSYKTKHSLNVHLVTHTEYEFKCTLCEKLFRHKRSLDAHMEYHSGAIEKPFVCDICEKSFRRNFDLRVCIFELVSCPFRSARRGWLILSSFFCDFIIQEHRRIHTMEKPFKCEQCPSNFRTMSSFYSHLKKAHGRSIVTLHLNVYVFVNEHGFSFWELGISVSALNREKQIRETELT